LVVAPSHYGTCTSDELASCEGGTNPTRPKDHRCGDVLRPKPGWTRLRRRSGCSRVVNLSITDRGNILVPPPRWLGGSRLSTLLTSWLFRTPCGDTTPSYGEASIASSRSAIGQMPFCHAYPMAG